MERLQQDGIATDKLARLSDERFDRVREFRSTLSETADFTGDEEMQILDRAKIVHLVIDGSKLWKLEGLVSRPQQAALWPMVGRSFDHPWMLADELAKASDEWRSLPDTKANELFNRHLEEQRQEIYRLFSRPEPSGE
jgi:hypothetical protein